LPGIGQEFTIRISPARFLVHRPKLKLIHVKTANAVFWGAGALAEASQQRGILRCDNYTLLALSLG